RERGAGGDGVRRARGGHGPRRPAVGDRERTQRSGGAGARCGGSRGQGRAPARARRAEAVDVASGPPAGGIEDVGRGERGDRAGVRGGRGHSPRAGPALGVKLCALTQSYAPTSGGIRTVLHAQRDWYRERGLEHVLIVPGPADTVTRDDTSTTHTVASPLVPGSGVYRLLYRSDKVLRI